MSAWNVIAGVLYHGLQGRWRLGGLEPAQNFDEAVTKAQLDAIAPFPFTGNALIDGTLNIDFTDTLSFFTGVDDGNDLMGFNSSNVHGSIFMGVSGDENEAASLTFLESPLGNIQSFTIAEEGFIGSGYNALFPDEQVTYEQLTFAIEEVGAFSVWKKILPDTSEVQIGFGSNETGLVVANDLIDDSASIFKISNNNSATILDLLNDNLQSDILLANNFANDAAAETGGVPVGGLYHNAGALRIRIA